jgi:hypothetical protein
MEAATRRVRNGNVGCDYCPTQCAPVQSPTHQLDAYLDVGLTKFAIRQAGTAPLDAFIDRFVAELAGRQN